MTKTRLIDFAQAANISLGGAHSGEVDQNGGNLNLSGTLTIGNADNGVTSLYHITGGTITMTGGEILSAPNAPHIRILLFDNAKPPGRPTDGVEIGNSAT